MWQPFLANLLFLLLQLKLCLSLRGCKWQAVLNIYSDLGGVHTSYITQKEVLSVADSFKNLTESAIDPNDKDAHYYGFPYYLKISLVCISWPSDVAIRMGHYSGLRPIVTVTFKKPVNAVRQKQERLQIRMMAAPYRVTEGCGSEDVCKMFWLTPMPFRNGSVVTHVLVKTNGLGLPVANRWFHVNVNGFMELSQKTAKFRIGKKLHSLRGLLSLKDPSRPLWSTHKQAPVLILGGIPEKKAVFISDTGFETYYTVEVGIDSCWIGSVSCPQGKFSSTIVDTIATESTLFIRQNQLVYYFTGHYPILHRTTEGSELWTRILNNVCVKKLVPVFFHENDTEYVIALGGGSHEGEFFLITCKDGAVQASGSLREDKKTVCDFLSFARCSILWATLSTEDKVFYLLVHDKKGNRYHVVSWKTDSEEFEEKFELPYLVPKASDKGFVMLLGTEDYTNTTLLARGLAHNRFSTAFYIWGNVVLQSYDMVNYIYLSNFPSHSPIKDFVLSFAGSIAFVTDLEEVWVSSESGKMFKKVYPSDAWNKFHTIQVMQEASHYTQHSKHSIISIFYDMNELQELIYREDVSGRGRLIKRPFPVDYVLTYDLLISTPHKKMAYNGKDYIKFSHRCPFAGMRMVDLPHPQRFTRMEHYHAMPPDIMERTGLHDNRSLTIYQGLVYQLLQLHSSYHRSYADPVHDPTWRWWKNKKEDAEYYNYMASNWKTVGGIYVDMADYVKVYDLIPNNRLPAIIFLDKKTEYTFKVFLTIRTARESMGDTSEDNSLDNIWVTVILAHPEYVQAELQRQELISRGSVLYRVTIRDNGLYPRQQLSGKNLLQSSAGLKVAHSEMFCYHYANKGPQMKGTASLGVHIGCPPGKRLAFDITYTKNYSTEKNKRYFDCVEPDPEMPCFYFSDVFYPFFLIQDMVTGDSGRFHGSYIFHIIGGGAFSLKNIRYFSPEEMVRYNPNSKSKTQSLIWDRADIEDDRATPEGFLVLSEAKSGIVWICQEGSPCYDIVPKSMVAPHYYFVIKVSNRGVDQTTYCDYALEFIVHIHGLHLSPTRALYLWKISTVTVVGLVVLYILVQIMAPAVKEYYNKAMRKLEEAIAFRAESSLTFSSVSFTSQGSLQRVSSEVSHSSSTQHTSRTAVPGQGTQ
ncbi:cation channel sperm-associated auxiliary subunit gamma [Candoia aspera]|uniref:cation channel sperm-associated auxiliary subunit gamma n=1 Tax=Candoia aspera TaxID=51853 RepID=UPI002FD87902